MNQHLNELHSYPFEKLKSLLAQVPPPKSLSPIRLSIGEPQHEPPQAAIHALTQHMSGFTKYPATKGIAELRQAIATWTTQRFNLAPNSLNPEQHVLPVSGTREALFAVAQAFINTKKPAYVLMPNPFYQIYEGAALLAGGTPYYLDCLPQHGHMPDYDNVPTDVWDRCQLLYLCSPLNPTGGVTSIETLKKLIALADKHDFIIAADECYSEIYPDESLPPPSLLEACTQLGRNSFKRCLVFHSLSKRSNLPGLRSGFVAGDANLIEAFLRYRTYQGCAMPLPAQHASIAAWQDEQHVQENRQKYGEKFHAVLEILSKNFTINAPDAGFCLWLPTPIDGQTFAQQLFAQQHVTVLPGSFLARENPISEKNPGENYVRIALVDHIDICIDAATRINSLIAKA